ncbi:MAG: hypothetical protein M1819_006303 [Sarea resinae]|nr:MAG: hypothetical protein M1819_006303 [Sarea resinae]
MTLVEITLNQLPTDWLNVDYAKPCPKGLSTARTPLAAKQIQDVPNGKHVISPTGYTTGAITITSDFFSVAAPQSSKVLSPPKLPAPAVYTNFSLPRNQHPIRPLPYAIQKKPSPQRHHAPQRTNSSLTIRPHHTVSSKPDRPHPYHRTTSFPHQSSHHHPHAHQQTLPNLPAAIDYATLLHLAVTHKPHLHTLLKLHRPTTMHILTKNLPLKPAALLTHALSTLSSHPLKSLHHLTPSGISTVLARETTILRLRTLFAAWTAAHGFTRGLRLTANHPSHARRFHAAVYALWQFNYLFYAHFSLVEQMRHWRELRAQKMAWLGRLGVRCGCNLPDLRRLLWFLEDLVSLAWESGACGGGAVTQKCEREDEEDGEGKKRRKSGGKGSDEEGLRWARKSAISRGPEFVLELYERSTSSSTSSSSCLPSSSLSCSSPSSSPPFHPKLQPETQLQLQPQQQQHQTSTLPPLRRRDFEIGKHTYLRYGTIGEVLDEIMW